MPPLVSIVLPVKNGLPHLTAALDAIRRQSYPHYEVVVQDGASTDGTLDYLASLKSMRQLRVESERDSGIGQAYGRALKRASGDLVCFAATDECLEPDALERAIAWFARFPDAVVVNGAVRMTDAAGETIDVFSPPHFDLVGHLRCEVVLPFAGLFDRRTIGSQLYYDESVKTCPDYDFWIRLGSAFAPHRFVAMKPVFKTARADRASMTFRTESFGQFCRDKQFILQRFLDAQPPGPLVDAMRRSAAAGIYLWAAESVLALEGPSPAFVDWCRAASAIDPWAARLHALAVRTAAFSVDEETGVLEVADVRQPDAPSDPTIRVQGLELDRGFTRPQWRPASATTGGTLLVETSATPWSYAAEIPLTMPAVAPDSWYWARFDVHVESGQIGIGPLVGSDLLFEETVSAAQGRRTVFVRLPSVEVTGIVVRNSGLAERSRVRVLQGSIERAVRSR